MESEPSSNELSAFRRTFAKWLADEVAPSYETWKQEGQVPRTIWKRAGELGFLCPGIAEEFGGLGLDMAFAATIIEELAMACLSAPYFQLHSDVVATSIERQGTEEQRARLLPKMVAGELIGASAMTEPNAGSDMQGIQTVAVKGAEGWRLSGNKTFVSLGATCDFVLVLARTGDEATPPMKAFSMFIVSTDTPGFSRGKPLKKMGMGAFDTVEMFFDDCILRDEDILGGVGAGMMVAMLQLTIERLGIGIECWANAKSALALATNYAKERKIFGEPMAELQDVRFKLASMEVDVRAGEAFVASNIDKYRRGRLRLDDSAALKLWTSEMLDRVVDSALQIHGGYGCMDEYPISGLYTDARIRRIYGGTSEMLREIVARRLLGRRAGRTGGSSTR